MAGTPKKRRLKQLISQRYGEDEIFRWVVEGMSQRRIAERLSKETGEDISQLLVWKWLHRDDEASARYEACRALQAVADEGRIQDVTEDVMAGKTDAATARVVSDNYKWLASKRDPRRYSERQQLEVRHSLEDEHLQALKDWHRMAKAKPVGKVIEGEIEESE